MNPFINSTYKLRICSNIKLILVHQPEWVSRGFSTTPMKNHRGWLY